jgi:hypothetical protein
MAKITPEQLLTEGLLKGYGGAIKGVATDRAGFSVMSIHSEDQNGRYHDEYAAHVSGGGQELVDTSTEKYTRVYAGGTIPVEKLTELGLTLEQVIGYLIKKITELGNQTRLHQPVSPAADGDWKYQYEILDELNNIPMTVGKESIFYQEILVFVHVFIICPVV